MHNIVRAQNCKGFFLKQMEMSYGGLIQGCLYLKSRELGSPPATFIGKEKNYGTKRLIPCLLTPVNCYFCS